MSAQTVRIVNCTSWLISSCNSTDQPSSERATVVDQESEDELLRRAIAMSLEDTGREEEPTDPNQMTEEEQIEYAMRLSLQ